MAEHEWLAKRFEESRGHLRGVAYRMLGSLTDADDAVQEAWIKVSRADVSGVDNLGGWLTTVVARVCLDMLRARKSRREEPLLDGDTQPVATETRRADPEHEALMADSVGLALLVVLDTLTPPERLAFVLHDMFALPFEEIAAILGRSPAATRQLASRARRRVQGTRTVHEVDIPRQREVVDAFLSALRNADIEGLLAVLDPELVVHVDASAGAAGGAREVRGARAWAQGAVAFSRAAQFAQTVLVNGAVGIILAPRGRLFRALTLTIREGRIAKLDVIADPRRLRELDLAVLDDPVAPAE